MAVRGDKRLRIAFEGVVMRMTAQAELKKQTAKAGGAEMEIYEELN